MSRNSKGTFGATWSDLQYQRDKGKPQPVVKPTTLALKQVKLWPEVFQQRRVSEHVSKAHSRFLAKKAGANPYGVLDSITVWWDGKGWACVDGHHRMAAYRENGADKWHSIPVGVFEGTLEAALVFSARANTRDKLQMGIQEKTGAAWRMVVATEMSKAQIADASGISERLVAYMRSAKTKLTAKGTTGLADMRWESARKLADGQILDDAAWDEDAMETKAQTMAALLHKTLGANAGRQVEVLARALEIYNGQLPRALAECWHEFIDDEEVTEQ